VLLARPGSGSPQLPAPDGRSPVIVPGPLGSTIGFGVGILTTVIAALFGARDTPFFGLVLMAGSVAAVAAATTPAGAVASAAQCWAFWDGFVLDDLGRLGLDRGGVQGLTLLMSCATAAYLAAAARRRFAGAQPHGLPIRLVVPPNGDDTPGC
jgi:hypothetical protein